MSEPLSQKPYLLRALYEWCVDNGFTPYVSVVVDSDTRVPMEYVRNGEIVLNIGPLAAHRLKMGNEVIEFAARFGGVARDLLIPVHTVSAIYARENGHGMSFEVERRARTGRESPAQPMLGAQRRPAGDEPRAPDIAAAPPLRDASADSAASEQQESRDTDPSPDSPPHRPTSAPGGGRPTLRRVK